MLNRDKILILHKNTMLVEQLARSLRTSGYSTILASNEFDAISLAKSMRPEIVLWGESLSKKAQSAIQAMKQSEQGSELVIIALSGDAELYDRIQAQAIGVDDFISSFTNYAEIKSRISFHQTLLRRFRHNKTRTERFRNLSEANFNMMLAQDVANLCDVAFEYLIKNYPLRFVVMAIYNPSIKDFDYFNVSSNVSGKKPNEGKARNIEFWTRYFFNNMSMESEEITHPKILNEIKTWDLEADKVFQFPIQQKDKNLGVLLIAFDYTNTLDKNDFVVLSTMTQAMAFRIMEIRRMFGTRRENTQDSLVIRDFFHRLTENEIYVYLCRHLMRNLQADRCLYMSYNEGFHFLYPKYLFHYGDDNNHFEDEKPPVLLIRDYPSFDEMLATNKSLIINSSEKNKMQDVCSLPGFSSRSFKNVVILPLSIENAVNGFFVLGKESVMKTYTQREVDEAERLINQATESLEENLILKRANTTIKQLDRIFDLGTELTLDSPLSDILKKIVSAIRRTIGWNIVILDRKVSFTEEFETVSVLGLKDADYQKIIKQENYPPFQDKLSKCFRMSKSYFYDHERAFSEDPNESWQDFAMQIGAEWNDNDWLYVPIESRGKILGMLSLNDPVERKRPTVERVKAIEYFANQAAVVIENTRLFESLKSSELKYRLLAETMTMGLITCDFNGRIIYANQSLAGMLKYKSQDTLLTKSIYDLLYNHHRSRLEKMIEAIHREEGMDSTVTDGVEIDLLASDNEEIPFMLYMSPMFEHNQKIGFFAVLSDLRNQKKLERLRSDFNSMIVHDLRAPLNIIQGYVDMVRTKVLGNITKEQEDFLNIARENVYKVLKLVDNFLIASKIDVGQFEIEPQVGSLNEIMTDIVEQHRILGQKKHITIDLEQDFNIPMLHFDKMRIEQVLTNFLSNAIKFTPEEGIITVTSKLKKKKKAISGKQEMYVEVAVADNGVGISKEEQQKVFNKYEQTEAGKNASLKGTGLGLAICHEIIEMHHGEIWVTSKLNEGSTFYFTLPIMPITIKTQELADA